MAEIKIKNKGYIEVGLLKAQQIEKMKKNPALYPAETFVDLETWQGELREITAVDTRVYHDHKNNHSFETVDREYYGNRKARLALSPYERAKFTGLFELLYKAANKTNPSPQTLVQARVLQEKFFADNPKRMYCDPLLFKPLIGDQAPLNQWDESAVRLVYNCVQEDMHTAKFS